VGGADEFFFELLTQCRRRLRDLEPLLPDAFQRAPLEPGLPLVRFDLLQLGLEHRLHAELIDRFHESLATFDEFELVLLKPVPPPSDLAPVVAAGLLDQLTVLLSKPSRP
jgi:hypothetical protein